MNGHIVAAGQAGIQTKTKSDEKDSCNYCGHTECFCFGYISPAQNGF